VGNLRLTTALVATLLSGCGGSDDDSDGGGADGTGTAGSGGIATVGGADSDSGDETGPVGACQGSTNEPPAAPTVVLPAVPSNGIVAVENGLALSASPFVDPNAHGHGASNFEIWEMSDGEGAERVWSATSEFGDLTGTTLASGTYDDPQATSLELWEAYGIRVRYQDDDSCALWSDWSEWHELRSDDGSEMLFDATQIHDVYITIPDESWGPINDEARPPGCVPFERSYYKGAARFDDTVFNLNVGVRSKGGCGSARYLDSKTAFKVNLQWDDPDLLDCPPDQRLFGQKKLTLNNMVQDPSYTREMLSYPFYEAMGIAVPRLAYVRVHVNDEYWGLYLHIESISRRFLRRWYDDNDGVLYEGTYGCDQRTDLVPPTGAQWECFDQKFQPDECDNPDFVPVLDHSDLLTLTTAMDAMPEGQFYPAIEQYVDFDRFLRLWAADNVLNNWDGMVAAANNYRIYRDPSTGLWTPIPSGVDQNFENTNTQSGFNYGTRMAQRCVQEPMCEAAFAEQLQVALAVFESQPFQAQVAEVSALISDLALKDPRSNSQGQFFDQQESLLQWIENRPVEVQGFLTNAGY